MANKSLRSPTWLLLLLAATLAPASQAATRVPRGGPAPAAAPYVTHLPLGGALAAPRAGRVPREASHAIDNDAEATDVDVVAVQEQQQQQQQQQEPEYQFQDHQETQEARHFSRLADDNYEDEQDIVYDFSYEVKDPHTGNDFGHRQSRSGGQTQGQYRVLLPDGRMQVVDYVSDRDGFRPNIRYEDVGIPVFAGTEQHEQFADGSNHFEQEHGPGGSAPTGIVGSGDAQGPSPDEVRRRRRSAAAAPLPHHKRYR